jgi:hypothetical protein
VWATSEFQLGDSESIREQAAAWRSSILLISDVRSLTSDPAVFETFVFEPEDVEVEFVALEQVLIAEALEALAFFPLVAALRIVAGEEIVEVAAVEGFL